MKFIFKWLFLFTTIQIMSQIGAWFFASAHGYQWGSPDYGTISSPCAGFGFILWAIMGVAHAVTQTSSNVPYGKR